MRGEPLLRTSILERLPAFPRAACPGTSSTRALQPPCLNLPFTCGSVSVSWGPGHNHPLTTLWARVLSPQPPEPERESVGLPTKDQTSSSGRKNFLSWQPPDPKLPLSATLRCAWGPWPRAGCAVGGHLDSRAPPGRRVGCALLMATWRPCLLEKQILGPLPSQGQGLGREPQPWWARARALGRTEARASSSPVLRCRSPFICLLSSRFFRII